MNYKLGLISALTGLALLSSCKKDEEETPTPAPGLHRRSLSPCSAYEVDGDALVYKRGGIIIPRVVIPTASRLFYYLSDVRLVKADSSTVLLKDF